MFSQSANLRRVQPSATMAASAKARALRAAGRDIISLDAGEPDFDTPQNVKEAAIQAIRDGKTKYTDTDGIPELKAAIVAKFARENGLTYKTSQVNVSPGGKPVIFNAMMATLDPGDEVVIPAPYWVSYPEMAKLAGAVPRAVLATDRSGFKVTPEQLEAAVTPRARLVILNSPSNPTGAVYSRAELGALMAVAVRRNLYVLSDEIYENLVYDGLKPTCLASLGSEAEERTIVASGFSKTYSMTGWRLGTLVAPAPIAKAAAELQSQMASNATTFAQYGALAALREKEKTRASLERMLVAFDRRRLLLHARLSAIPGASCVLAQGAFYLFPNISAFGLSSLEFCERLLEREKVAVVPGSAFGAEGYVRLSYATSDEVIQRGADRIERFCASLKA
jgi:aspartate aminotransferase